MLPGPTRKSTGKINRRPYVTADRGTKMDFRDYIRNAVGPTKVGLEFGASYSPIVAKRDGYNVFVVDHADEAALRDKYRGHAVDIDRIEPVDAIDDGGELTNLLPEGERFDYVV